MDKTQNTHVRILEARPKAYLVVVQVNDKSGDFYEPWSPGWIPRSQLNPDKNLRTGDTGMLSIPMWLVDRKGWSLDARHTRPQVVGAHVCSRCGDDLAEAHRFEPTTNA